MKYALTRFSVPGEPETLTIVLTDLETSRGKIELPGDLDGRYNLHVMKLDGEQARQVRKHMDKGLTGVALNDAIYPILFPAKPTGAVGDVVGERGAVDNANPGDGGGSGGSDQGGGDGGA